MRAIEHGFVAFAVIFERPHAVPQRVIIASNDPTLTTGGHNFILTKRPSRHMAKTAQWVTFNAAAMRLCTILNHFKAALTRQLHNCWHVAGPTCKVNRDHGLGPWRQHRLYGFD